MKLIAFVEGRCKPQPRTTQNVKFLFSNTVDYWRGVDAENLRKSELGELNKKGNPYKPTRYAYRLERLQQINAYREKVFEAVNKSCGGKIPTSNLFFFYLFHTPKNLSKKKTALLVWQPHLIRPDTSNITKAIEDCLYKNDSMVTAVAYYKLYIPREHPEGLMILEDKEIHDFVISTGIEIFSSIKPLVNFEIK